MTLPPPPWVFAARLPSALNLLSFVFGAGAPSATLIRDPETGGLVVLGHGAAALNAWTPDTLSPGLYRFNPLRVELARHGADEEVPGLGVSLLIVRVIEGEVQWGRKPPEGPVAPPAVRST